MGAVLNEEPAAAKPAARPLLQRLPWREVLVFIAVLLGIQLWQGRDMATGAMPPLDGKLVDGRRASLAATLAAAEGRPVLVYVWSAWCPVCRMSEGTVTSLADDWPVLTLAMQSGDAGEVAKFMAERGIAYPTLVDERGELAWSLGVRGVPAWFIVDGKGQIRFAGMGYTSGWGLRLRLRWASLQS